MGNRLRSAAAVVGVGTTEFGRFPGRSADDLAGEALLAALADAGLRGTDIDGLIVSRVSGYQRIAADYGIEPAYIAQLPPQGRMAGPAIEMAATAIAAGLCRRVALVYGNNGGSGGDTYGGKGEGYGTSPGLTLPYGMTSPGAFYALMFQRYQAEYGVTSEQLASVPLAIRGHAALNDNAVMRKPLTLEDYLQSRYIVEPLHVFDYCLINDGGVALIVSAADEATDHPQPPAYIRGFAQEGQLVHSDFPPEDFWRGAVASAGRTALSMADLDRTDVSALMSYDNFSPNVLFALEGLGYCAPGEAGAWVQDGRIALGGELPVNTNGGHLSESYMQGWGLAVEAVRQLRGGCGPRQVEGASIVQYICPSPIVSTVIYATER
jgi:acetyl-CoA acetyltransferase